MPMTSPTMTALMSAAMMAAMMLPSLAPTLWLYRRHLRTTRRRVARHTTLFAVGYAAVWSMFGGAISAVPAWRSTPWMAGAIIVLAGAVQCSPWKAKQLLSCHHSCVTGLPTMSSPLQSLHDGFRLGVHCCASCAAPMAVLLVAGLMDMRMMAVITAAITAERVAPAGVRIARLTGALTVIAGLIICGRATG